jgi:hypothetical protein
MRNGKLEGFIFLFRELDFAASVIHLVDIHT